MRKMGTIESRDRRDEITELKQKYPIIAHTLSKSLPVQLVGETNNEYEENIGEFDWQVQFDDNNQIPLDFLTSETAEQDYLEVCQNQINQREAKEIRKLAKQYFAKRPELKARFEQIQETICV